jgi:hypothetical protein
MVACPLSLPMQQSEEECAPRRIIDFQRASVHTTIRAKIRTWMRKHEEKGLRVLCNTIVEDQTTPPPLLLDFAPVPIVG